LAAEAATEESPLVFDLASGNAVVEEHTAQLLWNLMTDNIVPERVDHVTGWNSLYLTQPETVSGQVVADLDAGTITGEITERWACNNNCLAANGSPSWTTTRDTGWTATITDGTVAPGSDAWVISGSVAIRYNASITAIESPSECDGSPCYICKQQLCEIGGGTTISVPLEGWIDGETLSLAFVDRLQADAAAMDFAGLETTEFFMSRFSITITGAIIPAVAEPPPEEPPEEQPDPEEATANETAGDVDLPAGQVVPGVDAGSPPGEFGNGTGTDETAAATPTKNPGLDTRTLIAIVVLILAGTAGVLIIGFLIRKLLGWDSRSAAVDAVRAEGLSVAPDSGESHWTVLDQASDQISAAQTPAHKQPSHAATPSQHYAGTSGLKSGRYRQVEFTRPVYLERQGPGSNIELVTTKFTGTTLVGDPDPATPWRTPVYTNDGKELGWVKTSDVPD
jgi:hypothetical protein